jgi:hypothetical protein
MLVRKNFLRPYFICPEKIFDSGKKIFTPPLANTFWKKKKNSSKGLFKKKNNEHSKKFWKKFVHAENGPPTPITFLMVRP